MFNFPLNYWAIIVSALSAVVIGSLWYSPLLFGTYWMKESGMTAADMAAAKKKGMALPYFLQIVSSLVGAYVLAHFVGALDAYNFATAFQLAFWLWLGFQLTIAVSSALWDRKSWGLVAVNAAGNLVTLVVMSTILAYWQ